MNIIPEQKLLKNKKIKQVDAIKSLDPSNKLKQNEGIFPQNLMNDELQKIIKKDHLNYKSKGGKNFNFSKYSLPTVFKRCT